MGVVRGFAVAIVMALFCAPVHAIPALFTYSYTFPDMVDPVFDPLEALIAPGTIVSGTLAYDTDDVPPTGLVDLTEGAGNVVITSSIDGIVTESPTGLTFNNGSITNLGNWEYQFAGPLADNFHWRWSLSPSGAAGTPLELRVHDIVNEKIEVFDVGFSVEPTGVVPEPTSLALFGLGLAGAGIARRRKRKA